MKNLTNEKFDYAIIGFGKGGKTFAATMGKLGKKVALIEKSNKMYGGTCINVGCIPSKSLVKSAELSNKLFKENILSDFSQRKLLYNKAIEEKFRITSFLRNKNFEKLDSNPNITVITGTASFLDANNLNIKTENESFNLTAEKIIINTGATPIIPEISGLKDCDKIYVSETLMDLDSLPENLLIIGGGYIGIEFASMYNNFGSTVTVVQDGDKFLPREDEEIASAVLESLNNKGVNILFSTKITTVKNIDSADGKKVEVTYNQNGNSKTIIVDAVLVATGRKPNIEELKLENAGILKTERGAIKVDEHMQTSVSNIYAVGDVTGGLQFTYISLDDFRILSSSLLGDNSKTLLTRKNVPYSVFLSPPFSRVGLTEKEAIQKGYKIKVAKLLSSAIPKAQVLKNTTGLLKVIIDESNNLILGAHLFCEESHELINLIKVAMDTNQPYFLLRDMIFTHPTMSESFNDLFQI